MDCVEEGEVERDTVYRIDDAVAVWLDSGGGITIRAAEAGGDPVELSSAQARELARLLIEMADLDDK